MGIPDSSLQDLIEKIRSWVSWGGNDIHYSSIDFHMLDNSIMCLECNRNFSEMSVKYYCCKRCGRWLCGKCNKNFDCPLTNESDIDNLEKTAFRGTIKCCKFCCEVSISGDGQRKYLDKVHPSASPLEGPLESLEPHSPSFCGENDRFGSSITSESTQGAYLDCYRHAKDDGYSHARIDRSMTSLGVHPAPVATRRSPARSNQDEADDTGRHAFSPSNEYWNNNSDIDSIGFSARREFDNCKSMGSSPSESPSKIGYTTSSFVNFVQQRGDASPTKNHDTFGQETLAVLRKPEFYTKGANNTDDCSDDLITLPNQSEKSKRPLDFENNGLIWFPPPPDDENVDADSNFFSYAADDDEMGDSGTQFSSSSSLSYAFPAKEKNNDGNKEPLKAVIEGHFRALVSQLLLGEGIKVGKENSGDEDWLDIVATLAWQAANFVKPDTSKGGSMDPVDYVKVKCIATGNPRKSTLVKGVVCTKNIKHKRMTSQYKNPRLLLLGGALEYHKVPNELSSFDTLLQQEKDHLKMIISKIEAHRTNVLLVEKTVSSCAQEYLLAKEISLVLNVKKSLLERISRCTGSAITPSIDHISAARLGHCELFRLERVVEEHENNNQFNRKPTKTLMFFEGCPRRLGCTVLLKGGPREELRKIKHVVQYAVFAAYHLSLEISFLADEGATLPMSMKSSAPVPESVVMDDASLETSNFLVPSKYELEVNVNEEGKLFRGSPNPESSESVSDHLAGWHGSELLGGTSSTQVDNLVPGAGCNRLAAGSASHPSDLNKDNIVGGETVVWSSGKDSMPENLGLEEVEYSDTKDSVRSEGIDENGVSSEYFSATDSHQSILVYFSTHCVSKGTVCEKSQLLRIKFYGSCDKPLGKYLREDLFDETYCCKSCPEPAEAHILCFTHQQGNLTINVRRLPSIKLPGEKEGKIWMWHRCLRCALVDGVPPATRRVVMSDAARGLSFGKFLELSFSNHAAANRVATCGHSLQRDCLRFYGCGSMVAFFRYSPINVHSVSLPPSVLEFNCCSEQEWIRKDAAEVWRKMGALYTEISDILERMEDRSASLHLGNEDSDVHDLQSHIIQLKEVLGKEKIDYSNLLQTAILESHETGQMDADILELNRMRQTFLISSHIWDHRLNSLNSLLKRQSVPKVKLEDGSISEMKDFLDSSVESSSKNDGYGSGFEQNGLQPSTLQESSNLAIGEVDESDPLFESWTREELMLTMRHCYMEEEIHSDGEIVMKKTLSLASHDSNLSDRIDSAWTGSDQLSCDNSQTEGLQSGSLRQVDEGDNPTFRRLMSPMRVHSFDSASRLQDRIRRGLAPSSLHLSALKSFHTSGDYRNMVKDPVSNMKARYQVLPWEAQKLNLLLSSTLSFSSIASQFVEGVRLLPQSGHSERVIAVYDDEPTSIISYALSSKEHEDWVSDKLNLQSWNSHDRSKEDLVGSRFTSQQSLMSLDLDYVNYVSHASEDASSSFGSLFTEPMQSPHFRISFGDDSSSAGGTVKFSVTCYFAKQFDLLRKQCCPPEADFLQSLSRCRRWSAQGGKSNVFFAKTLDERFIIKQVIKTELESFEEFAPQYFKYLTESLSSGSPTCLAKILGIYQVSVKYPKGGKETKMDLMVMENLFYKRSISTIYDLKGSVRSRYNPDTSGTNKVLLDMNLLETLRTKPIFLGSRTKRKLERAVWNDTSFLASVDVMDYSLLVGVDEERKELVLGIIDFMRQYTWDKHLETWVKASGILGGPRNTSPTVISPKQYKKRFRKAMTTYFLTLPDHWSP